MRIDNLYVYAMVSELNYLNEGGARIEKIHQPTQFEIMMALRTKHGNQKMLISIHPETFRLHMTTHSLENPKQPKAFCVVLRKYLEGGKIIDVVQLQEDRLIQFTIEVFNSVGDLVTRYLYVELMGKYSNIILTDADHLIIDVMKKIDEHVSEQRELLPKIPYQLPQYVRKTGFSYYLQPFLKQWLTQHEYGPEMLLLHAKTPKGFLYRLENQKVVLSFLEVQLAHVIETIAFATLSEAMDHYFYQLTQQQQLKEKTTNLLLFVKQQVKKNAAKVSKLEQELQQAEDFDSYQKSGNLLLAHQHVPHKFQTEITVIDYYDEALPEVTIALKPRLSIAENAQNYFKKHNKGKTAVTKIKEQLAKTHIEIAYFATVSQSLADANLTQAEEIAEELQMQGYLKQKRQHKAQGAKAKKVPQYLTYEYQGIQILVGKNNIQNDYVTFKKRRKDYLWLHIKDFPGAHVLVCHKEISPELLLGAALLAAYYSKMRLSENVAVDYTLVQYVSKPTGAKPGYVIYKEQQTLFVTPSFSHMHRYFETLQ